MEVSQVLTQYRSTWLSRSSVLALLVGALFHTGAQGADFAVVSVVRNFPMKSDDEIAKDYYINAGTNNGLKDGAYIEALRRMAVHDNVQSRVLGDTAVPIARLKIIHIDKTASIARMVKFYERKSTPLAGYDDVVVGDLVKVADKQSSN